jgi:C1A family cysteine protease
MISKICSIGITSNFEFCKTIDNSSLMARFAAHVSEYGLSYATIEEYQFRLKLFEETDAELERINAENENYTVAHNQFSTMTQSEKKKYLGRLPTEGADRGEEEFLPTNNLAGSVDWRSKGAVNPVQNQGGCGSCWAFSTTAAVEGAHFVKTGKLLKLSESELVDCDTKSSGCNGGLESSAMTYLSTHGQELESDYPYVAKTNQCKFNSSLGKVKVLKQTAVPAKSADQLKAAIAIQPTCVAVDASDSNFMHYSSGILDTTKCGTRLDHAITAVGYGTDNGKNYFIVRNSWSASWGEKGYIRVSSDVGGAGVCGILLDSRRPTTD